MLLPLSAFAQDAPLLEEAKGYFEPIPMLLRAPDDNAITREKVALGKMLYFDPRLSSSHLLSCNTCHNIGLAGTDILPTSVGHGWQRGPRNAPTVLNSVFNVAQFWDGRAEDLKAQATGPMQAAVEMNSTPERILRVLSSMPEYRDRFARAFPGEDEPLNFDNVAKAIEAFEVTLVTPSSRFDQYLEGREDALDDEVTNTASDEYVFRAVPLRNVALTAPYFHSGQVWDLKQAVGIMGTSQLGAELSGEQIDRIVAFLHTLTGEQPQIEYPILPPSTDTTPVPELMVPGAR